MNIYDAINSRKKAKGGAIEDHIRMEAGENQEPEEAQEHDAEVDALMANGGHVVAMVQPHVRPIAVALPQNIVKGVMGKRMATGGLDDDAPPMSELLSRMHMADGGEVGPEEDEDYDFLEPQAQSEPQAVLDAMEGGKGHPEEDEDQQQDEGNSGILRNIMRTLKARHGVR